MSITSPLRVDRWLWAVRVFKTRSQANEACTKGRVRVNGEICKPATKIKPGDRVEARRKDRVIIYEVVETLEKRVGAALAANAIVDLSPPAPPRTLDPMVDILPGFVRDRGTGRPTKRDRRQMEKHRRRE
ncbi:MAG: RNA-binding S4 domain-containing protein [Acidimicrobiales bacterium]|nr:RNA-binding S4 domain-containing protein [Acidimicrobiales bacterium]